MKEKVIEAAKKRILFLPHAIRQISRPDRMISMNEVRDAIFHGEVIEEYPQGSAGRKLPASSYEAAPRSACGLCPEG